VTVLARDGSAAAAAAAALPPTTQPHRGLACDVSDPEAVRAVFAALPPVHVLVNAAGVAGDALLLRASDADIAAQLHTNLAGAMYTSRAALRGMLRAAPLAGLGGPTIIQVGSVVGHLGNSGQSVYAASKAGLVGFTRALAAEVGPRGIRVNMVAPGFVNTAMTAPLDAEARARIVARTALRRLGEPADVAAAIEYLVRAPFVTGQVLTVDGGLSVGVH
jgi:NAD(P)-dependent dehydrogenase (short-subunit alcohol dehydrogenase family)